mmetsp:Transcript_7751/g.20294  ORF Transcript_7751/g.20294 Transcript_7751/m.20294 type:complete len:130 (+) Transcript_7751:608-997(+)
MWKKLIRKVEEIEGGVDLSTLPRSERYAALGAMCGCALGRQRSGASRAYVGPSRCRSTWAMQLHVVLAITHTLSEFVVTVREEDDLSVEVSDCDFTHSVLGHRGGRPVFNAKLQLVVLDKMASMRFVLT